LQRLSLESNLISNLGLTGLSKALIDNEALEELYLYNNDIDDESIESFLGMLKNKTKLRILGMEYNKIRNKGDGIFRTVTQFPYFERLLIS
jgi:hypothetical protein